MGDGYVHGGAVATVVLNVIIPLLANIVIRPSAAANLNVSFRSPLRLNTTTLITATIESVIGRKISLTSKITSPNGKIMYGDSTALFVLLDRKEMYYV